MRYKIVHIIGYDYDRPVMFDSHVVRLRPRSDVTQMLHQFALTVSPDPTQLVETVDLDGNTTTHLWFPPQKARASLEFQAISEVETFRTNPFDFLLERWAANLPIDYSSSLLKQLRPYLAGHTQDFPYTADPVANQLAHDVSIAVGSNTVSFLTELNQRINQHCKYIVRDVGEAMPASVTWTQKVGSCRDFAMLFIEACRAVGLAARFVSGYQQSDADTDELHLHAWAEVYLPGAGWRGYDPTNAIAVADHHIALVASPFPQLTKPVTGALKTNMQAHSEMHYRLAITSI
jgi:transglutaminase-like putative cysteine protease